MNIGSLCCKSVLTQMILKYCVTLQYNTLSRVELDKGFSSLENMNESESVSCTVVSDSLQSYGL